GRGRLIINMAAQGLDDEAASRWCGWLDGRLEAACVGEWNAEVLDLSSNKLTAAGLGLILWLLLHYHVQCDAVRLGSNNQVCNQATRGDDGLVLV
ncbi:unnamed protein product, partial [Polarella glacialis]